MPTFVAVYRASSGTINILTCEAPSECLVQKEDCTATHGIKSCHHIDWVEGVLKLAMTSTAASTSTMMPSSTDTDSVPSASDSIHKGINLNRVEVLHRGSESRHFEGTGAAFVR